MLERLKAGEWEPPAEVPRELIISSLERQAEVETGTIELWAREDDSTTMECQHLRRRWTGR